MDPIEVELARLRPYVGDIGIAADVYQRDPFLLAALCLRESQAGAALTPPGPDGTGDHGHGRGLFQIDDRGPYAVLVQPAPWAVVDQTMSALCALKDAEEALASYAGSPVYLQAILCAYNAGASHVRSALRVGENPDAVTTHGDYGSWILSKRGALSSAAPGLFAPATA